MSEPKRHHFLPQFYLEGFTRDGLVWIFDREKTEYRRQQPKNTAVVRHLYTLTNGDGEKDYGVEKMLSNVEGAAKQAIINLEAGNNLLPQQRVDLAYFLAFLACRVPKAVREANDIADAAAKLIAKRVFSTVEATAAFLAAGPDQFKDMSADGMHEFVQKEQFRMKLNQNFSIEMMVDQSRRIAKEIVFMDWLVVHADPHSSFTTTDSPIGFVIPNEIRRSGEPALGIASEKVTKLIPLSGKVALLMGSCNGGFGHSSFTRQQVREFNIAVATECERYVIGADEPLLRVVVKRSKVDTAKPGTRMKVEHIPHPTDPNRTFLVTRRVCADAPDEPLQILTD